MSSNSTYRYYSNYATNAKAKSSKSSKKKKTTKKSHNFAKLLVVLVVMGVGIFLINRHYNNHSVQQLQKDVTSKTTTKSSSATPKPTASVIKTPAVNECAGNTIAQLIIVSINARHLWACQYSTTAYDSAVITGDMYVAADVTPVGNYKIYAKYTDTNLIGSDSRGSWDDYVNYWMPFYHSDAYGTFGFHDATWRTPQDFGNISPYSDDASHGCVEMPLAAAQWLYNWSVVGTSVSIRN